MDRRSFLSSMIGALGFATLPLPELAASVISKRPRAPFLDATLNGVTIRRLAVALIDLDKFSYVGPLHPSDLFREDLPADCIVAESDATEVSRRAGDLSFEDVTFPSVSTNALCGAMVWAELSDGSQPVLVMQNQFPYVFSGADVTVVGPRPQFT